MGRLELSNLLGESSRLVAIRRTIVSDRAWLGIRLTLFMRPMGRRGGGYGAVLEDSVAHLRVSKKATPRIVRTHR